MSVIGGDITGVNYSHPLFGSGVFYPKAGEDSTFNLGGIRSEDDNKGVDGGGQMIDKMSRNRWSFEVPISWDMNDKEELEKLVNMAASPVPGEWTFTHISGVVYAGQGKPVGDIEASGMDATITLKVQGGGKLKKI